MKKMWLVAATFVLTTAVAGSVHAASGSGVLFDANLYYGSSKTSTKLTNGVETTNTDGSTAIYDIKLGYLSNTGLYLGGLYTSRSDSALNASGTNGNAIGASVGYFGSMGFFIQGNYLLSAEYGKYKEGKGMQVDLGYKAGVGSGWLLGGELTYRSIGYKKNTDIPTLDTFTVTEVVPMISIGYLF